MISLLNTHVGRTARRSASRRIAAISVIMLALASRGMAQCPAVGASPDCAVLITINPNGALSIKVQSTQPYDGSDDALVGVVNKSGATVFGISLSGNNIFGFDGDGLCTYITCTWPHPMGYEGPGMSFSRTNSNSGIVNFTGTGLADNGFVFFSLESAPQATQLATTVTIDPGHGHSCPAAGVGNGQHQGTTGGGLSEDDLTVFVALALKPLLTNANYTVTMTKADVNSCPELLTRGEIANHARSNLFVSIHFNKPATSILGIFLQAHGSIGLYNGSKSSAKQLAGLLSANVSSSLGINNQGATEDDGTAVLKATVTDMTASIIEVGRLSGPDLTAILGAGAVGKVAAGIKAALDNFIKQ